MVKRPDAVETSLGRVRDTDSKPVQSAGNPEVEDTKEPHDGWYKPEMGTIIVNEYPPTES
jgi:hypothetical protein